MFEALLFVCLSLVTVNPDPCAYINVEKRMLNSTQQCHFWLKQGAQEIQTMEHFYAIRRALGSPKEGKLYIKGECREQVLQEAFVCKDCEI